MPVTVDVARCDGNGECVKACAFGAIEVRDGKALVFDNCTDCGACVRACGPMAISSPFVTARSKAAVLAVDFSASSAIASLVGAATRAAEISAVWRSVDSAYADAGQIADAIAAVAKDGGYSFIALPHHGAGPAIAARAAQRLEGNLLAGCSEVRIDDDGSARALRPRFGGIVKAPARGARGVTVATIYPRAVTRISASELDAPPAEPVDVPDRPTPKPPPQRAWRLAVLGANLSEDARRAAVACAAALGAEVVDVAEVSGKQLSPDLCIAFGVQGSTEHNAALRNGRVVVAVVADQAAPIAQVADFLLVGSVEEHAKALLAAL